MDSKRPRSFETSLMKKTNKIGNLEKNRKDLLRKRKSYAGQRSCLRMWWKEEGRSRGMHDKMLTKLDRASFLSYLVPGILNPARTCTACDNLLRWPFTRNGHPDTGRGESSLEVPVQGDDNVPPTVRFPSVRAFYARRNTVWNALLVSTA